MPSKKPKTLIWDIETSLMEVSTFSLWPKYIGHTGIIKDWELIGGAYKWHGEKRVYTAYQETEKERVVALRNAVAEADIIVAHNGDKFDWKKLNTKVLEHGLDPLPKPNSIDTLKVAKKEFAFTSNRLDYIGQHLGLGGKLETSQGLWMRVLAGEKKAIKEMRKYNIEDVRLLERVYDRLRPYIKNHPNLNHWSDVPVCPNCGGSHITRQGFDITRAGKYQKYQCQDCGAWSRGKSSVSTTEIR